jgi:16S rRNA (guanine1207-N2)-methyltransferase
MDHYFSGSPQSDYVDKTVALKLLNGNYVELKTASGVFSTDRVDPGTQILLNTAPPPKKNSHVLDLGCGYGPITIWCATAEPTCTVTAVDVNERALELCRANVEALGLTNVAFEPTGKSFDRIYSNPPARIGKEPLHKLLSEWLHELKTEGDAYLVVQRHLGSDSLSKWLAGQGHEVEKIASKRAYRVLRVSRST